MATRRRRPTRSCHDCGQSEILPIRYGLPGYEMMQAAARGEIALGGCYPLSLYLTLSPPAPHVFLGYRAVRFR